MVYCRLMMPPAGGNSQSGPWRGMGRLLCAAAVLHLALSVTLSEVGRRAALPKAIDHHGIVMVVMSDAPDVREDAAGLSGALRAGEVRHWLGYEA